MEPSKLEEKRKQAIATIGTTAGAIALVGSVAVTTIFGNVTNAKGVEAAEYIATRPSVVRQTEVDGQMVDKEKPKALSSIMSTSDGNFLITRKLFTDGVEINSTLYEKKAATAVESVVMKSEEVEKSESVKLPEKEVQSTTTVKSEEVAKPAQKETEKNDEQTSGYEYKVTPAERKAIEKLVYVESRGEPHKGKVATAAVVLNRVKSKQFANDVMSVITAKNQFAKCGWVTQKHLDKYPDIAKAVDEALKGADPTKEHWKDGALYFFAPKYVSAGYKQRHPDVYVIGGHAFHRVA